MIKLKFLDLQVRQSLGQLPIVEDEEARAAAAEEGDDKAGSASLTIFFV